MAYLYVTMEKFDNGNASSTRILSICKSLKDLGNEVIVISLAEVDLYEMKTYKGVKYLTTRCLSGSLIAKSSNYVLHHKRLKTLISKLDKKHKIEGVFFYDIPPLSILYLKKYSSINKIKLFHDSVEWYSPEQFKWGKFSFSYNLKNILNSYLIDKQIYVISISKYLFNYFNGKGIHTTRIPVIVDVDEMSCEKKISSKKLTIMYAGAVGKKDYLKEIVEGIAILNNSDLQLRIIGINKNQLIELCKVSESTIAKCGKSLIIKGRITRDEVLKELEFADFTVLLRSSELRYAKAGFPTKVVESLSAATPVICNITSDLGDYLVDAENSLIVTDCSAKSFALTLRRALSLSFSERQVLCSNARKTAEQNFDYKNYLNQFNSFVCKN